MTRQEQLIYAAGFFDGEGCISISRKSPTKRWPVAKYHMQITAFQGELAPLELLRSLFGGSVCRRPYQRNRTTGAGWIWVLGSTAMVNALQEMRPYLLVKGIQADVACKFQGRKVKQGGKYQDVQEARRCDHESYLQLRALKSAEKAA